MYYGMMNQYATEASDGFSNSWYPVVFESIKARNEAIKKGVNACRVPTKAEYRQAKNIEHQYELPQYDELKNTVNRL
jgi:hypothetical protein